MADTKFFPEDRKEQEGYFAWVMKQIEEHPVVKQHHGQWKELIEWENGNQYSMWDNERSSIIDVPLKKRKEKVVVNMMKPLGEAIDGKINVMHQIAGVPNSSELEDVNASIVATKLIAHNDYVNSIEELFEEMKYDLRTTGNGFIKWSWDTSSKGYIRGTNAKVTTQPGEVICEVPSVFNIRPDPTGKKRKDWRWLIEVAEIPESEILANFEIEKEELQKQLQTGQTGSDKFKGMNEPVEEKDIEEPTYIVALNWERSSKEFPKGRLIISTGTLKLWAGENPALGEIPYFHFGYKRKGNSIWHTGPLHHVQSIQRTLNRTISIISEHIHGWRAKMILPEGANLKQGAFTTDSFEILEVDTTKGTPHPLNTPELSGQVTAFRDFLINSFDRVSNVHEVSYSQLPQYASRAPASLYSMMLEQESLKIDPLIKRMNKTILEMGSFRLRLMDKYYNQERLIKVIGKGQTAQIEYFKGADLKGNFDVKLVIGVSIHQSKVIQQKMIIELKTAGIITNNNRIIKLLEMGDISDELRSDIADESRAQRENQAFINDNYNKLREKGGVFIYLHDDHAVHLDYHTNLGKTEEAQLWTEEKWRALQEHIMQHFQMMQVLMQAQGGAPTPPKGTIPTLPGPETIPGAPGRPIETPEGAEVAATRTAEMP
jgi:hypothetical protein